MQNHQKLRSQTYSDEGRQRLVETIHSFGAMILMRRT